MRIYFPSDPDARIVNSRVFDHEKLGYVVRFWILIILVEGAICGVIPVKERVSVRLRTESSSDFS